jgi:ubiquinone/menaquinone biosynthesis C-methylase UbiE
MRKPFQPHAEPDRLSRQIRPLPVEMQQAPEARAREPENDRFGATRNIPRSSSGRVGDAAPAPLSRVRRRYGKLASVYELTLGERLLYADARRRAIELLRLAPGATVVDVACGTGLNFPLIEQRIGPSGTLIGVDLTAGMLGRARARVQRAGWSNVKLVQLDATSLTRAHLEQAGVLPKGKEVDAVLCTLGMSVIPEWEAAWLAMVALVRPGGTAAIMDGSPPPRQTATTRLVRPLIWLGCRYFAADWTREPWKLVERDLDQVEITWSDWGYVHAAGGTKRQRATETRPQRAQETMGT